MTIGFVGGGGGKAKGNSGGLCAGETDFKKERLGYNCLFLLGWTSKKGEIGREKGGRGRRKRDVGEFNETGRNIFQNFGQKKNSRKFTGEEK